MRAFEIGVVLGSWWSTVRNARPDGRGAPDLRIGWPNRVSLLV
jgi:hypothetical protein